MTEHEAMPAYRRYRLEGQSDELAPTWSAFKAGYEAAKQQPVIPQTALSENQPAGQVLKSGDSGTKEHPLEYKEYQRKEVTESDLVGQRELLREWLEKQDKEQPVGYAALIDDVEEYLHWRKVNPQIKGGENYLKRFRQSLVAPMRESGWLNQLIVDLLETKYIHHNKAPEESGYNIGIDDAVMAIRRAIKVNQTEDAATP